MNWLARLKKIDIAPEGGAAETTKRVSVVFVGPSLAPKPKNTGEPVAANDATPDPDRWSWPHSEAMTTVEIDTFTMRLERFTAKGLALADGVAVADKLVTRDRDGDERRLCLECQQVAGYGPWRCNRWRRAGLGQPAIPADMAQQLQRCDAFTSTDRGSA